jgi:hypothetical protein
MKKLFLYSTVALLTLATTMTVQAKDKRDKRKSYGKSRHRVVHVERHSDRDRRDSGYRGDYHRDRTRRIYVIERDRPVQRVVYVDGDGRYYRWINERRVYVRERYYESYPSRYYTRDGRRRVNVSFSF